MFINVDSEFSHEKQKYDPVYFRRKGDEFLSRLATSRSLKTGYTNVDKKVVFKNDVYSAQYETKEMDHFYDNEEIIFLTKKGLENHQVFILDDIVYRSDLTHYTSSAHLQADNGTGDMIVMDEIGNTFICSKQRGVIHHSSFFSGSPLSFAGLVNVVDGTIYNLVIHSGHYRPTYIEFCQLQTESDRVSLQDVDPSDIKISLDRTGKELVNAILAEMGFNLFSTATIIHAGKGISLEKRLDELRMRNGTIFWFRTGVKSMILYKKWRISAI